MSAAQFIAACIRNNKNAAKSQIEQDPGVINKFGEEDLDITDFPPGEDTWYWYPVTGWTGLMATLQFRHHSLARWLLSLPGLDTNVCDELDSETALHFAVGFKAPLDIVIQLEREGFNN